jgi:hypothetical protein
LASEDAWRNACVWTTSCVNKNNENSTHICQSGKFKFESLSNIDNFELKDYFVKIICQIVSWYCSFKRPEFQILIKIMDRVYKKNISQIWKLLEKLKNSIFFLIGCYFYNPSPVFKILFSKSLFLLKKKNIFCTKYWDI